MTNLTYPIYRPLTLPSRLGGSSLRDAQQGGLLSASPLRFQQGLWKVPEGTSKRANNESPLSLSISSPSALYSPSTYEQATSPVLPILSVLEYLADEDTQLLRAARTQLQQGVHWLGKICTVPGSIIGAGVVVSLYVVVPALHLWSSMGLPGWEHLVAALGMLGLGELSIVSILRKTTIEHHHLQPVSLKNGYHSPAPGRSGTHIALHPGWTSLSSLAS